MRRNAHKAVSSIAALLLGIGTGPQVHHDAADLEGICLESASTTQEWHRSVASLASLPVNIPTHTGLVVLSIRSLASGFRVTLSSASVPAPLVDP